MNPSITNEDSWAVKGTLVRNIMNYTNQKLGEEFFLREAREVELIRTNSVLPSSWFALKPYREFTIRAAKALDQSIHDFQVESSKYTLEVDLPGIFRFALRLSGPGFVMSKVITMSRTYTNFSKVDIVQNVKGDFKAYYTVPSAYFEWGMSGTVGAIHGIFSVCRVPLKSVKLIEKKESGGMTAGLIEILY